MTTERKKNNVREQYEAEIMWVTNVYLKYQASFQCRLGRGLFLWLYVDTNTADYQLSNLAQD